MSGTGHSLARLACWRYLWLMPFRPTDLALPTVRVTDEPQPTLD